MAKGSEKTTDALVAEKLPSLREYPAKPNVESNGIIWFAGDSYKDTNYKWLAEKFKYASKSQSGKDRGTPDFMVVKQSKNTIVVIENKREIDKHSRFNDVQDYKQYGYGSAKETQNYAIDGAVWYATFLNSEYDVVAVAVSGDRVEDSRVTSFVLPKNGKLADIELLEDMTIKECLVSIDDYITTFNRRLGRDKTDEDIKRLLRRYTLSCANFLRANGIEDNDKAGFVSALILALTNKQSTLYTMIKRDVDCARLIASRKIQKKDIDNINDSLGNDAVDIVKYALYGKGEKGRYGYVKGVFDIDDIPKGKRLSLEKYYNHLLDIDNLLTEPRDRPDEFRYGTNVLSACLYSLFLNVTELLDNRTSIDIMGEFYTTFLRFTKGNAKEKGIVLTPKHITDLFCDIAEYYGEKLTEKTKVIDICCGTGAFLIAALNRIKENIYKSNTTDAQKEKRYKKARENSLIGIENNSSMYSLAYANMRFHGDGKANLFNCSCLLSDSYASTDSKGLTYNKRCEEIRLADALSDYGDIDFAFINPPYSLDKKKSTSQVIYPPNLHILLGVSEGDSIVNEILIQKGIDELDFVASMLHYLKIGGIGIAIVPMSCAGNSKKAKSLRAEILKYHTLLACMTMPNQLFFDSHVGVATCIMVFKAHIPHDINKAVFLSRWKSDGFKVIPHNGRKETEQWGIIRKQWIEQLNGTAPFDDKIWLKKKINITDEALAEAYVKTDYSKLTDADFERTLKKYALFKYMDENGLLEEV